MDTVSVQQGTLRQGIATVASGVARRPTLPVLSHILLQNDGAGMLTLATTDLERMIRCSVRGQIGEIDVAVPAKVLQEFVASLPDERVDMTPENRLLVQCAGSRASLSVLPGMEFPRFPLTAGQTLDIAPDVLKAAIDSVAPVAANDESRPILTGCLVEISGATLTISAADGFRLATRTMQLVEPVKEPISAIIPASTLLDLGRLLAEEDKPVTLGVSMNLVWFLLRGDAGKNEGAVSDILVTSQVIEGNFPKVESMIPTEQQITCTTIVDRAEILDALHTVRVFSRSADNHITLDIQPGEVTITSDAPEIGHGAITIPGNEIGSELAISVNAAFFGQAIRAIDAEKVALDFISGTRPITVRESTLSARDPNRHVHVLMPMMLRDKG